MKFDEEIELTEDEKKIIRALHRIDNLFKNGDVNISLFANSGTMEVIKDEKIIDDDLFYIKCDGGDYNFNLER